MSAWWESVGRQTSGHAVWDCLNNTKWGDVLVTFCCVVKYSWPKATQGRKEFFSSYCLSLNKNWKQKLWRNTCWLFAVPHLAFFLFFPSSLSSYSPRPPVQGMVPLTVGWTVLYKLTIKIIPNKHAQIPSDLGNPSIETPFLEDSRLCQVDS